MSLFAPLNCFINRGVKNASLHKTSRGENDMKKTLWKRCAVALVAAVLVSASGCKQSNAGSVDGQYDAPKAETGVNEETVGAAASTAAPQPEVSESTTAVTTAKADASTNTKKDDVSTTKKAITTTKKAKPSSLNGQEVVNYAKQYLGTPYVYGGSDLKKGVDCSGFTGKVFEHFSISLPRTAAAQDKLGSVISYEQALPGDLCTTTYATGTSKYTGHAAIYIGNGRVINALPGEGVVITDLYTLYGDYTFHRLYNNTAPKKSNPVVDTADDDDEYDNYDDYDDTQEEEKEISDDVPEEWENE